MKEKSKKKMIIVIIILVIIVIFLGVLFLKQPKKKVKEEKLPQEPKEYTSAYRLSSNGLEDFDLHFLQLENEEKNKIYSPLSIKYALAMLKEGTKGDSKAQIDSVIGDYQAKKYVNSSNMSLANVMFIRETYQNGIKEDYIDILTNKYGAEVIFDPFVTADHLNSWVSDKTFQLVNHLFDDVSSLDFVLANALAIDMEWNNLIQATTDTYSKMFSVNYSHEKFSMSILPIDGDRYDTIDFENGSKVKAVEIGAAINKYDIVGTLGEDNIRNEVGAAYDQWLKDGGCGAGGFSDDLDTASYLDKYIKEINSNYKQIKGSTDFLFYDDENVKSFAKNLKEYHGTTLQYVGIMPKTSNLHDYVQDVNSSKVNDIISKLKDIRLENFKEGVITKIIGHIPLFKFDYKLKLMDDLKLLGITDVFDSSKADLSNMTDDKAVISSASHKASIEFSNEGIKAAAATSMGGMGSAGCWFIYDYDVPVETIDLTFDKPYLFLIRDKETGEVWFTGTVYEPIS